MNILQSDIDKLNLYAKKLLIDRNDLSSEDITQDAIIKILESGNDFNLLSAKAIIKELAFRKKLVDERSLNKPRNTFSKYETTKYCKGCNEVLPIACFQIQRHNKNDIEYLSKFCKNCLNKMASEIRKTEKYKKRYKDWWDYQIKNLTDIYIKILLRKQKKKIVNPTSTQIENKRKILVNKKINIGHVSYSNRDNVWAARIHKNKKRITIGYFKTKEDALNALKKGADLEPMTNSPLPSKEKVLY